MFSLVALVKGIVLLVKGVVMHVDCERVKRWWVWVKVRAVPATAVVLGLVIGLFFWLGGGGGSSWDSDCCGSCSCGGSILGEQVCGVCKGYDKAVSQHRDTAFGGGLG